MHRKYSLMDIIITCAIKHSCLTRVIKGSDYVIRNVESVKFRKDARSASSGHVQSSSNRRLIPLALNHLGLRGGHIQAMLKEFATILVTRPRGSLSSKAPSPSPLTALSTRGALASHGRPKGNMRPRLWELWMPFMLVPISCLYWTRWRQESTGWRH